ncbi:MAG: hypothetical protein U1A27_10965 [Phycisphaerae bacterium]
MSQLPSIPGRATRSRTESDVYSVLSVIAAVFLCGAVVFLVIRLLSLYGTVLPPAGG